jgi:hypothetical protein
MNVYPILLKKSGAGILSGAPIRKERALEYFFKVALCF